MFTGIIQSLGTAAQIEPLGDGLVVWVSCPQIVSKIRLGDSVSVEGICSTVTQIEGDRFKIDYLKESCDKTTLRNWQVGQALNLELSLTPTDRIGGHFVTGHVDCTGQIALFTESGVFKELSIRYPSAFSNLVVPKGSIAVNGISLTIAELSSEGVIIHLIPHTLSHTSLQHAQAGDLVNLEFDLLGKYVEKSVQSIHANSQSPI